MADVAPFTKLIPGFDFLEGLVRNATGAMPAISNWVAPTLNPEELDKRIQDLKAVKFWLEQNARLLSTTIQALEVQRMTLTTLRTMNVRMDDLRESMKIKIPDEPRRAAPSPSPPPAAPAPRPMFGVPAPAPSPFAASSQPPASPAAKSAAGAQPGQSDDSPAPAEAPPGVVDPMQWWAALTKQFTELAAVAIKESTDAMKQGAAAIQQTQRTVKTQMAAKKRAAKKRPASRARQRPVRRAAQEPNE